MHHLVCVIIWTNGRRNDREGVRWLTGRRTCGLQSHQGSSRGALPGGRQRAFRYPGAASSAVTSNALTNCSFWITLKDGVHVAEIPSRYRSTVHPCTCLCSSPFPHIDHIPVRSIGGAFLLLHTTPEAAIPPDSYRLAVSKMRCMDLFICVYVCHSLRAC